MPQRKVVDICYCYAPLLSKCRQHVILLGPKWLGQSNLESDWDCTFAADHRCLWQDEQLHGCTLRLLLPLQPHAQQVTVPWAGDDSVTLK